MGDACGSGLNEVNSPISAHSKMFPFNSGQLESFFKPPFASVVPSVLFLETNHENHIQINLNQNGRSTIGSPNLRALSIIQKVLLKSGRLRAFSNHHCASCHHLLFLSSIGSCQQSQRPRTMSERSRNYDHPFELFSDPLKSERWI
jgi:hypothetical protein